MHRGFADTPAGQIHYRELGSGAPLVLLHEVARSSDGFSEVQPCLAARYRTIAMDMPGYGDSYRPAEYPGMAGYAAAVIAFFDAMGLAAPYLLGFHTGSAVAAEVAATYPDRVSKLVVCGLPDARPETRAKRMSELHGGEIAEDGSHFARLGESLAPFAKRYWGWDYAQRYGIDFLKAMPTDHWGHQAVYEQQVRERIPHITAPTLLFCSANDVFVDLQPELAPLFRDVVTTIVEESEKFPLVNQPATSCVIISDFLG